jgi:hypothetical protein
MRPTLCATFVGQLLGAGDRRFESGNPDLKINKIDDYGFEKFRRGASWGDKSTGLFYQYGGPDSLLSKSNLRDGSRTLCQSPQIE